jgi:hypothetical protein
MPQLPGDVRRCFLEVYGAVLFIVDLPAMWMAVLFQLARGKESIR